MIIIILWFFIVLYKVLVMYMLVSDYKTVVTIYIYPSDCTRINLRAPKIRKFSGGACPQTPLAGTLPCIRQKHFYKPDHLVCHSSGPAMGVTLNDNQWSCVFKTALPCCHSFFSYITINNQIYIEFHFFQNVFLFYANVCRVHHP